MRGPHQMRGMDKRVERERESGGEGPQTSSTVGTSKEMFFATKEQIVWRVSHGYNHANMRSNPWTTHLSSCIYTSQMMCLINFPSLYVRNMLEINSFQYFPVGLDDKKHGRHIIMSWCRVMQHKCTSTCLGSSTSTVMEL